MVVDHEKVRIEVKRGAPLKPIIPALARLRTDVFRDWPYLYDGDPAYEECYLATYAQSPRAAVVVAYVGEEVVGAATCLPLADETGNVQAPFLARGWDPARFFYYGESVLRPELRGRGIGVAFFEAREAHACAVSDCDFAAFCGVVRPPEHPACPPDYVPLDAFWKRRGFTRRPDLVCRMAWKEVGAEEEREHDLVFWMKSLGGATLP
jgi:GNAT superfamily N-acetyltransferase